MAKASDIKKRRAKVGETDNFLEALRGIGTGVAETASEQIFGSKTSGELKQNEALDLGEISQREKLGQDFQKEFLDLRQQEKLIFLRTEQEIKLQIKAVQSELKKLAVSAKNLAQEVETAIKQTPVEPGVYHLNFFERLRQTLTWFRKRIEESATWLAALNQRTKKRNFYWGQFKKSGTKFLLSAERYTATQAG